MCGGAPPYNFSADGQNWGFPTYNWEEMEKDDLHGGVIWQVCTINFRNNLAKSSSSIEYALHSVVDIPS